MTTPELRHTPAWRDLERLEAGMHGVRIDALFAQDPDRAPRFTCRAAGLTLDFSKQRLDTAILAALQRLAETQGVEARRAAMFAGEPINISEARAAWHIALRQPDTSPPYEEVQCVRRDMAAFVDRVREGRWTGYRGDVIRDVVNIGIGGSDLGPRMVYQALTSSDQPLRCHFVANVDPADLDDTLAGLDPAHTLFIVTSKSFTTAETLANARVARRWLLDSGATEAQIARHFVAVSTNHEAVQAFGIEQRFGFWDWVGGRFSLWSAVGLSIALGLGNACFEALLAGAHAMDEHFRTADPADNLPVSLALVGVWNRNFLGLPDQVVVPYAQRLAALPGWLQQLEMESNGKSVTRDGAPVEVATVPSVWGSVGTNAQHAYFQMLHQGSPAANVDFILPLSSATRAEDDRERQRVANCLAQAEALMRGRDSVALRAELEAEGLTGEALTQRLAARRFDGNRPSSMVLLDRLDAHHLGALLAAYEHKVFVQGVIWQINSFDQWGVELGKTMAGQLLGELEGRVEPGDHDGSTAQLLAHVRRAWRSA